MTELPNPFIHDIPRPRKTFGKIVIDLLQGIVIVAAFIVITYLFLVIPTQVDGRSMEPTFLDRELLFTNKIIQLWGDTSLFQRFGYDYKRGDVVIFQKPGHDDFIKRIVGLPGDKIMIKNARVYINDKLVEEAYLPEGRVTRPYSFILEGETKIVPVDHYFLMGDNRENSKDSRFSDIGFVARDNLKGRVFLRYWPVKRFSVIPSGSLKDI